MASVAKGDRVVLPFNVACGFCKNCLAGWTGFCLTVNPGFGGGAYGYVSMGPYRGGQAEWHFDAREEGCSKVVLHPNGKH